jgi:type I restriction enzyme S subunit
LFEEWFVRLRYPGHEHDKVIDGVPTGWSKKPLIEFCARITDGSHFSPKTTEFGKPMASVKDMREWDFDMSECRLISEQDFSHLVNSDCKPMSGDILVAKDGANLNKHTFLVKNEREMVVLSSIAIIRPLETVKAEYMVSMLRSDEVNERIKRNVSGAAIPRIVLKDFKRLPVLMPTREIQDAWQELCRPTNDLCRVLSIYNSKLAEARDLLLPRLMDGRIAV